MRVPSQGGEDPLKEGMAAHSSTLAWRIPWTEEPGGLQSTGSQSRAQRHQLSTRMFKDTEHLAADEQAAADFRPAPSHSTSPLRCRQRWGPSFALQVVAVLRQGHQARSAGLGRDRLSRRVAALSKGAAQPQCPRCQHDSSLPGALWAERPGLLRTEVPSRGHTGEVLLLAVASVFH